MYEGLNKIQFLVITMVVLTALVQVYNVSLENSISSTMQNKTLVVTLPNTSVNSGETKLVENTSVQTENGSKISLSDIIPSGVPEFYGEELGVSYDKPVEGLAVLKKLDTSINLEGELQERYIKVTTSISCEFCCTAESITFSDGRPACGCAHSYAMRGLAKYILQNHSTEYTDQEVLNELVKWKTLFFPKQMTKRALELAAAEGNYNEDLLNQVNSSVPDMVGGC